MNRITLIGRLTADPELRQTTANISFTSFTVAVDRPYQKDKERKADFINCVAWRNTADLIAKYLQKGSPICIEGRLENNDYTDKVGNKHYNMLCQVERMEFLPKNSTTPAATKNTTETLALGDMGDFEEIVPDGDVPF